MLQLVRTEATYFNMFPFLYYTYFIVQYKMRIIPYVRLNYALYIVGWLGIGLVKISFRFPVAVAAT